MVLTTGRNFLLEKVFHPPGRLERVGNTFQAINLRIFQQDILRLLHWIVVVLFILSTVNIWFCKSKKFAKESRHL